MKNKITYGLIGSTLLSFLVLLACSNSSSKNSLNQNENTVELNWKLASNDSIIYKTVMNEIGDPTFEVNFGGIFKSLNDELGDDTKNLEKDFFKSLKNQYNNTNLITKLTNSDDFKDVLNIELIANKKDKNTSEEDVNGMQQMMQSMLKGVMLRGSVYKNGSMHSFWVRSKQKNLISLFFELPNKAVKKGDSWTLHNVNFIGNDQNFICHKAKKKNEITLIDIIKKNGETIAVLNYDILEFVSGDFNSPAFFGSGGNKKTEMEFIFKAQAEFSVDKGKWISYNGLMSLNASGVMNSSQKQKFALIEE